MKKLLLTLALAFVAILAGNAAEKTVVLDLNSVSTSGKFSDNFMPSLFSAGGTTFTIVKESGNELEVEVNVPFEAEEPIQIKTVNYLEASLSYWDKDDNSIDLSPIPFDMTQAADLIKFLGTKHDENTSVKVFRFKGTIQKSEWEAYNKAESHFLNIMCVSFTVRP